MEMMEQQRMKRKRDAGIGASTRAADGKMSTHKKSRQDVVQQQQRKHQKPKFVRRRAVFGKRGTHARSVSIPEFADFAAAAMNLRNATQATDPTTMVPTPPSPPVTTATTMEPPVEVSEAYAVYCSLIRAGEWDHVDMFQALVHFQQSQLRVQDGKDEHRDGLGAINLLYFVCSKDEQNTADGDGEKLEKGEEEDEDTTTPHIVVPVSVTECRPTLTLLASILSSSKEWRRLAEHHRSVRDKEDEDIEADSDDDDGGRGQEEEDIELEEVEEEEDDDDDDDEEDEPLLEDDDDDDKGKRKGAVIRTAPKPVGISLAFVDNDGTTSLLRCYDTVEPPEPEANRYQVQ